MPFDEEGGGFRFDLDEAAIRLVHFASVVGRRFASSCQ